MKLLLCFCLIFAAIRANRSQVVDEELCLDHHGLQKRAVKTSFVLQKAEVQENPSVSEIFSTIADPNNQVNNELAIELVGNTPPQQTPQQNQPQFSWNHDQGSSKRIDVPVIRNRFHDGELNQDFESRIFDTTMVENVLPIESKQEIGNLEEISDVPTATEDECEALNAFQLELNAMTCESTTAKADVDEEAADEKDEGTTEDTLRIVKLDDVKNVVKLNGDETCDKDSHKSKSLHDKKKYIKLKELKELGQMEEAIAIANSKDDVESFSEKSNGIKKSAKIVS